MSDLLLNRFLDILNTGVTSGAVAPREDHAPEEDRTNGQESEARREVLQVSSKAAVRLVWDSRRLPPDYDGEKWA